MRLLVLFVLASLVVLMSARSAEACPCCDPCAKYDRMREREMKVLVVPVDVYVRERPAAMPRPAKRAKVMTLLTGSQRRPRGSSAPGVPRVRILEGSNVPDTVDTSTATVEIVHELMLEDGTFRIDLAGGRYQISPCRDRGRVTSCLVRLR